MDFHNSSKKTIQKEVQSIAILFFASLLIFADETYSDVMGRPRIENNNIVSDQGTLLRGGTFWIYGWMRNKTDWALSPEPWKAIDENNFNAMRVACAYRIDRDNNYSLEQYDTILDSLFTLADQHGVYLIIDFHDTPGKYRHSSGTAFWKHIAPRYKDRTNAIYELANEPVFSQPDNYTDQLLRNFEELWNICDSLAPETPIIILSFCQVGYSKSTPSQKADLLKGIDWKKTVVGFHSYWRDSSERIIDLKKRYPCINTEFMCLKEGSNEMKKMDGYKYHATLMEKLRISWLQWDILDREKSMIQKLPRVIKDLKEKGVFWINDAK